MSKRDLRPAHRRAGPRLELFLLALASAPSAAMGQSSPQWSVVPHTGYIKTLTVHDEDGPGPIPVALYIGGALSAVGAPPRPVVNIARFDGWQWTPMGEGLTHSITEYSDVTHIGASSEFGIVASGQFNVSGARHVSGVAQWTGQHWHSIGLHEDARFRGTTVWHNGERPLLVAAPGGVTANGKYLHAEAVWDGIGWTSLPGDAWRWDGQFPARLMQGSTRSVFTLDEDGAGIRPPSLIIAGWFEFIGDIENEHPGGFAAASSIVRWDQNGFSSLREAQFYMFGAGIRALVIFDEDGPGPHAEQLYIGGSVPSIGYPPHHPSITTSGLARWTGQEWEAVPGWPGGTLECMTVWDDDGPGPRRPSLFVGGRIQGHLGVMRFDGLTWEPLDIGFAGSVFPTCRALQGFDEDGDGPNPGGLYVGGDFFRAGGLVVEGLARWGIPLPEPCYADCDRAGTGYRVLDIFDFLCFQTRFAAGDPYACDADTSTGPRECDLFDYLYFQNAFAAGCP